MRKEKSIRAFVVGGSNAAYSRDGPRKFPELLNDFLKSNVSANSYVINDAVSGMGLDFYVGRSYEFESFEESNWPNLIILEGTINCDFNRGWEAALILDQTITYLKDKYKHRNFTQVPSVLVIDLFSLHMFYNSFYNFKINDTIKSRTENFNFLNNELTLDHGYRGCGCGYYYSSVARFYGHAMISTCDAYWPSFTKHFINNPIVPIYVNTGDGTHLSALGHQVLVEKMIAPFLMKHLQLSDIGAASNHRTNSYYMNSIYDSDLRMFPMDKYHVHQNIHEWSSWGTNQKNTLIHITPKDSTHWQFTTIQFHNDSAHICYGSNENKAIAQFHFKVPRVCGIPNVVDTSSSICSVHVTYIKSWNTSYIGDVECMLYALDSDTPLLQEKIKIIGNLADNKEELMRATTPKKVLITSHIQGGNYALKCDKLDNRFSCFTALSISRG